jgi:DNA-binding winged helix-turn-helix (wHTH) protein
MIYVFDEYELDLRRYELRHGNKPVKLEPQVFNLLVYLIQHRDRLVSKEELFEQVWSGRVVSETALTSRLMAARRAIGDRGRDQHVIQTVHGRGYRFIATVEERADETPRRIAPPLPARQPVEPLGSRATPDLSPPLSSQAAKRLPYDVSGSLSEGNVVLEALSAA